MFGPAIVFLTMTARNTSAANIREPGGKKIYYSQVLGYTAYSGPHKDVVGRERVWASFLLYWGRRMGCSGFKGFLLLVNLNGSGYEGVGREKWAHSNGQLAS